jgi:hypothetical protein
MNQLTKRNQSTMKSIEARITPRSSKGRFDAQRRMKSNENVKAAA